MSTVSLQMEINRKLQRRKGNHTPKKDRRNHDKVGKEMLSEYKSEVKKKKAKGK
jgi:hypothetical protein